MFLLRPGNWFFLAVLVILLWIGNWAVIQATWTAGPPSVCANKAGACWSFIAEKWQLILYGRYPAGEIWRPTAATALLLATAALSTNSRFWGKPLLLAWLVVPALFVTIMHGAVLGLRPVPPDLWGGLPLTVMLATFGIVFALPLGIVLAIARQSSLPALSAVATAYIEMFRGIPLITVLFLASFVLPLVLPPEAKTGALLRVQVCIILFSASYIAEIVRGGLQSIQRGQQEAAAVLGISSYQSYRRILIPQALTRVIPALVNTFIELFKDTSLVAIVSLSDLLMSTRQAIAEPGWRMYFVEAYVFIGAIYFVFCFVISRWSRRLERQYGALA